MSGEQQRGGVVVDDVDAARGRAPPGPARPARRGRGGPGDRSPGRTRRRWPRWRSPPRPDAACDSGARPRFVCTTTPVALMTGRRLAALAGNAATASSATCSGSISPARARSCACGDNGFHQRAAEQSFRLGEPGIGEQHIGAGHAPSRVGHERMSGPGSWRRRTGIEPASDRICRSAILKTAPVTRPDTPPWPMRHHGRQHGGHGLPADPVRPRRRLRLQDPARRAGGRGPRSD